MSKKIFSSIMIVAMTVLLAGLFIASSFLYDYFNQMQAERLNEELQLAAVGVEKAGVAYFEESEPLSSRFTLIAPDGEVLYDSAVNAENMDNHLQREEIADALRDGSGTSERYSSTLTEQTFYRAVLLSDGSVLRVSATQVTAAALLLNLWPIIAAIVLFSVIPALVLSRKMAKSIVEPLAALNLESPAENDTYEELAPILSTLVAQHKEIINQTANAEHSRREFTANVSHELKTPLQSIIGSAELLEAGLVKPEDTAHFVGNIKKEATRLVTLINDIIRLSQLDEGAEMPCEAVELDEVIREVADVLSHEAAARQVELNINAESCTMSGVRRYLYEIVYNLCDNAIRYNREGGIVGVSLIKKDSLARLVVSDTGIGIPEEEQNRIFERFYRVDKSHSKETGGTGLGLSIVKHAVQYHGGKIKLASTPGQGTEITVEFPL